MQDSLASLVHPVFASGLMLEDRLNAGETLQLETEQARLKDLLLSDFEARRYAEFGGGDAGRQRAGAAGDPRSDFLGVRYALTCWLDELFTRDGSPWCARWNERKLEVELYGSNDRAWRFWEQAKLAAVREGDQSLEVFFLCVTLGFRGQLRDQTDKLQSWLQQARARLGKVEELQWPRAADLDPPTFVPPLRGRERLQKMLLASWVTLLALAPLAAFVLVRKLGR